MADAGVRTATRADVAAVADVQLRTWRTAYAGVVPARVLAALSETDAEARWAEAVEHPPTPRHRVLVAVEHDRLVGFAALGPSRDEDTDPAAAGEVYALLVDVDARGRGHGSRLLAATVESLRAAGCATAYTWLFDLDAATRAFFAATGWAADGSRRNLDMGEPVGQLRLHTDLRT